MNQIWTAIEMGKGQHLGWRIGPLQVWVERGEMEWRTRVQYGEEGPLERIDGDPGEGEWQRWAAPLTGAASGIRLEPCMPDRPLIVRPAAPTKVLVGQHVKFYIGVPIAVRLVVKLGAAEVPLFEVPTVRLSNSWFGEPTDGEPCYALRTRARTTIEELEDSPHRARCTVHVHNDSREAMDFQRLCLRVSHLAIYEGGGQLWTNAAMVDYRGESELGRVNYDSRPPDAAGAGTPLGVARELPAKNVFVRTFGGLKGMNRW